MASTEATPLRTIPPPERADVQAHITLSPIAERSILAALGFTSGNTSVQFAAGWVFVASVATAWYVAGAMMLEGAAGKVVLPLGKYKKDANTPGKTVTMPIQYEWAEPGIRKGQ